MKRKRIYCRSKVQFSPSWSKRFLNRPSKFGFPSGVHRLSHDERGLYLLSIWRDSSRIESQFEWRDVTSAAVFQRDCFSVDLLCLAFFVQVENVRVNEEMPGWKELVKTLPLLTQMSGVRTMVSCRRFPRMPHEYDCRFRQKWPELKGEGSRDGALAERRMPSAECLLK